MGPVPAKLPLRSSFTVTSMGRIKVALWLETTVGDTRHRPF
jgi:hypothetical protein